MKGRGRGLEKKDVSIWAWGGRGGGEMMGGGGACPVGKICKFLCGALIFNLTY